MSDALNTIEQTRTQGIVTLSGRTVLRGEVGDVPAIGDIAASLSRITRFAGHTRGWWSVLDHTLFMVELARAADHRRPFGVTMLSTEERRALMLFALFHDAHESITSDIPSTFKTDDMKAQQAILDERLFARYHVRVVVDRDLRPIIRHLDHLALLSEAHLVGAPIFGSSTEVRKHFGAYPEDAANTILRDLLGSTLVGTGPVLDIADDHPGYQQFINHYLNLV